MPRAFCIDPCSAYRRLVAACGVIAACTAASTAAAQDAACNAPQQSMQQVELMFGRNIAGKLGVSEAAWSRFLAREVTPRFPDGLSVLDAAGQWQDKARGRVVREPSKLIMIVTADDASARDKIAAIIAAYKQQFHQQSVGMISRAVCASF
jgi:uncharacterized protein DUF3574